MGLKLSPLGYEAGLAFASRLFENFHRVEIVEDHVTIALAAKDVDLVPNERSRVTIAPSWLAPLFALVPPESACGCSTLVSIVLLRRGVIDLVNLSRLF